MVCTGRANVQRHYETLTMILVSIVFIFFWVVILSLESDNGEPLLKGAFIAAVLTALFFAWLFLLATIFQ